MGTGGDFGKDDAAVLPSDKMSGTGDLDGGFVISPFDRSRRVYLKQLGMERSSVELKNKFSDFRTNRKHDIILSSEWNFCFVCLDYSY